MRLLYYTFFTGFLFPKSTKDYENIIYKISLIYYIVGIISEYFSFKLKYDNINILTYKCQILIPEFSLKSPKLKFYTIYKNTDKKKEKNRAPKIHNKIS